MSELSPPSMNSSGIPPPHGFAAGNTCSLRQMISGSSRTQSSTQMLSLWPKMGEAKGSHMGRHELILNYRLTRPSRPEPGLLWVVLVRHMATMIGLVTGDKNGNLAEHEKHPGGLSSCRRSTQAIFVVFHGVDVLCSFNKSDEAMPY